MKITFDRTHGLLAAWLLAALSGTVTGHSWPEQTIRLAPNGTMVGKTGTERAHLPTDAGADFKIPPNGGLVQPTDKIVRDSQGKLTDSSYSDKFPMLSVAAGDFVAIKHRENGHVTRADVTDKERPVNRGTIYLYGTTENDLSAVNLMDVHLKWTSDGKGGNGKGKLLATRNYDDGQCYEKVPAVGDPEGISTTRKKAAGVDELLCQSNVQIPEDAPVGKVYSVIWVWDWPLMSAQGAAVPPAIYEKGTEGIVVVAPQLYTGVVDYKIVDPCDDSLGSLKGPTCASGGGGSKVQFAADQPAISRGIATQMAEPFLVKVPQAGFDVPSATADPKNIPLAALIGVTPAEFPLPASILQNMNKGGGAGGNNAAAPAPTPAPGSEDEGDVVVTATSIVPEGMATETVTRGGAAAAANTDAPKRRTNVHGRRQYR
ncbi:hypothetical protein C8A00DRAFT_32480 [Chaetomidium leptoderma]|uniref:DUF7492 domain-containing protein n=1 Tax=Chaetomidium leptoderma TaxID=669021 RepID=A0AAN6VNA0_9PEZI|nr:hypothetical protein C8A00DRAFT_32480 [Chaetomidium leptoderma]